MTGNTVLLTSGNTSQKRGLHRGKSHRKPFPSVASSLPGNASGNATNYPGYRVESKYVSTPVETSPQPFLKMLSEQQQKQAIGLYVAGTPRNQILGKLQVGGDYYKHLAFLCDQFDMQRQTR